MTMITIPLEDLIYVATEGAIYLPAALPKATAKSIKEQAGDEVHLEEVSDNCHHIWLKAAWEQELKRKEYLATVTQPSFDKLYPAAPPKQLSAKELNEQLLKAIAKSDMAEVSRLTMELSKIK